MRALSLPLPNTLDLFDSSEHYTTKYKHQLESIEALGRFTTRCLQQNELDVESIRKVYIAWREAYIVNSEALKEVHQHTLQKEVFGLDDKGYSFKLKCTIGTSVFNELCRLYALLHYKTVCEEQDNVNQYPLEELSTEDYIIFYKLKDTKHDMWISIVNTFEPVVAVAEEGTDKLIDDEQVTEQRALLQALWSRPIIDFSLRHVRLMLFFLTQQLNEISCVTEYERVFHVLMIRMGQLMSEEYMATILDDEEMRRPTMDGYYKVNRDFVAFCSFYGGEIMRRLFYHDLLKKNCMQTQLNKDERNTLSKGIRAWVRRIIELMPEDAFEDMYNKVAQQGYNFAGDDNWFRYYWPTSKIHSRNACIYELRPHLHKRFCAEGVSCSKQSIINATNPNHLQRLFIFQAIDEYIRIQVPRVKWEEAVIIDNGDIELSEYKLQSNLAPLLFQVLSHHYAYDQGKLHVCSDIYETIGVWFYLVHSRYKNFLFDCDITGVIRSVLGPLGMLGVRRIEQQQNQQSAWEL